MKNYKLTKRNMKIESSELISSESIFHSLDVSITNSVFCQTNTNESTTKSYNNLSFLSHSVSSFYKNFWFTRSFHSYVRSSLDIWASIFIGPRLWNSLPDTGNSSFSPSPVPSWLYTYLGHILNLAHVSFGFSCSPSSGDTKMKGS